ncbi:hypothetical protein MMC17_003835 [Xylographa soralifera]|nr:hypothetical protein [Xylographa soralifera]
MDSRHTFDFVEGTIEVPIAQEIQAYYPPTAAYFNYFSPGSVESIKAALNDLGKFLAIEGPYDAFLGFSQGSVLAATYILHHSMLHPTAPLPVRCALFLSGNRPLDPAALQRGEARQLDPEKDGIVLRLPTVHIWGFNDKLYPGTSESLYGLCKEEERSKFCHQEGHDIPSARAKDAVLGAARAIRRMVDIATIA